MATELRDKEKRAKANRVERDKWDASDDEYEVLKEELGELTSECDGFAKVTVIHRGVERTAYGAATDAPRRKRAAAIAMALQLRFYEGLPPVDGNKRMILRRLEIAMFNKLNNIDKGEGYGGGAKRQRRRRRKTGRRTDEQTRKSMRRRLKTRVRRQWERTRRKRGHCWA